MIDPGLKSWLKEIEAIIESVWSLDLSGSEVLIYPGLKSWLIGIEIMIDVGLKP